MKPYLLAALPFSAVSVDWYYDNWCGGDLEYLNDGKCKKIFPSNFDREWSCPNYVTSNIFMLTKK